MYSSAFSHYDKTPEGVQGTDVLLPIIPAPWRPSHENPEFEVSLGYTANLPVLCLNEALEPWNITRPSWPQFYLGKPSPQGWHGAHTRASFLWGFCFLSWLRLTSPSSRGHKLPTDVFSNVQASQTWIFRNDFIRRAGTKILFGLGQPPTSVSLLELHLV